MTYSKTKYSVEWKRWNVNAKPNQVFRIKATTQDKAVKKVYKKLFTREDRNNYVELRFARDGALVQIRNTNQSGFFVGSLTITEE